MNGLPRPLVRWTNFKEDLGAYQGSLVEKERYYKAFFDRTGRKEPYDTSNLNAALAAIVDTCTAIGHRNVQVVRRSVSLVLPLKSGPT